MLSVGDRVTDDTFEEGLEDTTSLFVDHWKWLLVSMRFPKGKGDARATY